MRDAARRAPALALSLIALAATLGSLAAQEGAELVLAFGGDVIFDAPIEYALRRTGSGRDEASSYAPIFQDVAPVLSGADLAVVNLETPVAARTRSRTGEHDYPTFAAPEAFLAAVAAAGVDAVGVANNHAYDQGVVGLSETLAAARAAGLATVGAAATSPGAGAASIVRVRGLDVALLQFSEATNWRVLDEEADSPRIALLAERELEEHVRAARAGGAALVVAMVHWSDGRDPDHVPSSWMRRFARLAATAGADLVVGHGTHAPAGSEVLATDDGRAVPVLWSLGNLAAVMEVEDGEVYGEAPSVRDAWLARVRTEPDGAGRLRVRAIEIVPFWIDASRAEGALPFVRPLDLERERGVVRAEACGAFCERLEAAYARRGERAAHVSIADARVPTAATGETVPSVESDGVLVAHADVPPRDERAARADVPPRDPRVAAAADTAAEVAAPDAVASRPSIAPEAAAPAPVDGDRAGAGPPRLERHTVAAAPPPAAGDAAAARARSEPDAFEPDALTTSRPARRSTVGVPAELARGVEIRITFPAGSAEESAIDETQLGPIVELLRTDRFLYAEVIAHPSPAEPDRAIASRRARRLRGLIAIRGPSRSHLTSRIGAPADHAYLELRLWR